MEPNSTPRPIGSEPSKQPSSLAGANPSSNINSMSSGNNNTNKSEASFNPQFVGMPKHSILSQQADLNTGSFSKREESAVAKLQSSASSSASTAQPGAGDRGSIPVSGTAANPFQTPKPSTPATTPTAASAISRPDSKPLPQFVSDASEAFKAKMAEEKAKSVAGPQSNMSSTGFSHSPVSMSMNNSGITNKTTGTHMAGISDLNHSLGVNHSVVLPDMEQENSTEVPKHANKHLVILIVSVVIIIGILAGGFYYWYTAMGGKAVLAGNSQKTVQNETVPAPQKTTTAQQNSAFPAGVTQPAAQKPAAQNTDSANSLFAAPANGGLSDASKQKVIAYLSANINRLSPVKSSIGFSLNDIQFDGKNHVIISYSDNTKRLTAAVNVSVDTSGTVKVSGFTVLSK